MKTMSDGQPSPETTYEELVVRLFAAVIEAGAREKDLADKHQQMLIARVLSNKAQHEANEADRALREWFRDNPTANTLEVPL